MCRATQDEGNCGTPVRLVKSIQNRPQTTLDVFASYSAIHTLRWGFSGGSATGSYLLRVLRSFCLFTIQINFVHVALALLTQAAQLGDSVRCSLKRGNPNPEGSA